MSLMHVLLHVSIVREFDGAKVTGQGTCGECRA